MRAKCFDEETKTLILERLRVNELGVQEKKFKWEQLRECKSTHSDKGHLGANELSI
jgi:hypothetical protein